MSGSRVAVGIIAAVAAAAAAHELASILVPLVIAVFLMILVETIARVVRKRAPALPRWFGFAFGIVALAAALVGSVWVVGSYAAALAGQAPAVAARIDEILAALTERFGASPMTLDRLVGEEHEIVTVIEGDGASGGVTRRICGWLEEHRPDAEAEVHHGGQPLYPYLFGVE